MRIDEKAFWNEIFQRVFFFLKKVSQHDTHYSFVTGASNSPMHHTINLFFANRHPAGKSGGARFICFFAKWFLFVTQSERKEMQNVRSGSSANGSSNCVIYYVGLSVQLVVHPLRILTYPPHWKWFSKKFHKTWSAIICVDEQLPLCPNATVPRCRTTVDIWDAFTPFGETKEKNAYGVSIW